MDYEGKESKELKNYKKNEKNFLKRPFKISNLKNMLKSIRGSDIIYLGDFHTFDQSSKNLERLIRALTNQTSKLILGFEFIHYQYQENIDHFLNGYITELEFLESIDYKESWRFPWNHYKVFFEIAKRNKHKIVALNFDGTLHDRDLLAADIIKHTIQKNPEAKLLILYGELHIMPNKLPKIVSSNFKGKINQTIIHQNLDEIFWKLREEASQDINKNLIVSFNKDEFCLQTSPPWIKYESMVYWYEHLTDDPEFDLHDYIIETGLKIFNSNTHDNFLFICKKLKNSLCLPLLDDQLEDFQIYDHQNLSFIKDSIEGFDNDSLIRFYLKLLETGKTFNILNQLKYYCPSYSINRLSFLAGIHIWKSSLRASGIDSDQVLLKGDQESKFIYFLFQLIMAYFSSKLINPFRKCEQFLDYKELLKKGGHSPTKTENIKLTIKILETKDLKKEIRMILKGKRIPSLYYLAKNVGYIMGDLLYERFKKTSLKGTREVFNDLLTSKPSLKNFLIISKLLFEGDKHLERKKRLF